MALADIAPRNRADPPRGRLFRLSIPAVPFSPECGHGPNGQVDM